MNNPRITAKERNLIKGALRRVFSRSELRKSIIVASIVDHSDPKRKRVKTWCRCPICLDFVPKSYMQVDHIEPVIRLNETLEEMSWEVLIDRLWCDPENLMPVCIDCHDKKTKEENKIRREIKKGSKKRCKKR